MTDFDITTAEAAPQEWRDRVPYVPTQSPLFPVFNGYYWDVSVGPKDYSQSVASCMANATLGYGVDDAGAHAKLFAAAPDLLEALVMMVTALETPIYADNSIYDYVDLPYARAAIAKATAA